ncbi:MAG: hypothetical protein ACRDKT_02615 [Actinomycetota bacterium]
MKDDVELDREPRSRFAALRYRLGNLTSAQQFWVPLAIVLVLALAGGGIAAVTNGTDPVPIAGEEDDDGGVVAPVEEAEAPGPDTVFDDPGKYVGQELTLSVVVEKVVDANTFRVVSEDPTDPSLLVVYSGLPVVKEQSIVKATGTITAFTAPEVNKALGAKLPVSTFDLSDDEFALVARSVEIVLGAGGGKPDASTDTAAVGTGTTAVAIAPPAPAPAPYVPPTSSDTSTGSTSGSGDGTSSGSGTSGGSSGGGSGGSSEPSGGSGSGGSGGSNEPSGGSNGSPAATSSELTFTDRNASSGQYSDATYFEALLTEKDGTPLQGKKLTFVLDGTEYAARTNSDGVASTTPTLSSEPGNYQLEVLWQRGDETRAKDKTNFEVLEDDSVLQVSMEGNGKDAQLVAHLTDGDNESTGLASRQVDFFADGELIGSATTDGSGVARLDLSEKHKGKRDDFSATFNGDDYYLTSSDSTG